MQRRTPQREEIVRAGARRVCQFGGLAIRAERIISSGPEHAHNEIGILQWWLAYSHSDVESFIDAELGVRLINRTTRRLSLTEPGKTFHRRRRGD